MNLYFTGGDLLHRLQTGYCRVSCLRISMKTTLPVFSFLVEKVPDLNKLSVSRIK